MRHAFLVACLCAAAFPAVSARSSEPTVLDLWPGATPGDKGIDRTEGTRIFDSPIVGKTRLVTGVSHPTLTVYLPPKEKRNGTAMIICPGGGYWELFWELEGEEVAAWLESEGIAAIILKYRCPRRAGEPEKDPAPGPQLDAQRAVRLVRSHAEEWGLKPDRIGMVGFSAGGHLALATATNFARPAYEPIDDVDRLSSRPDFAILCYPGYLKDRDRDALAPGIEIPRDTPPVFLAHASDDNEGYGGSLSDNSVVAYLALKRAGVRAELHVFATGDHDFGVRQNGRLPSSWPRLCLAWLRSENLLPRP